jgi:preprotein translocase subunit SecB
MVDQAQPQGGAFTPLAVNIQYIKDLSFENPKAPQIFVQQGQNPNIAVNVRVDGQQIGDATYEIVLHFEVGAKTDADSVFLIEMDYAGVVTLAPLPQEAIGPMLMVEAPRLLFPFARQVISNTIAAAGFPPLMINPIDFADLYRRQLAAQQAQRAANPAGTAPAAN